MARIRSIKPEFFRDEDLQDLEAAHPGKYAMLVFAGLWGHCDKAGRFQWLPRSLKLDILPFLAFDMEATLGVLQEGGFVERYEVNGKIYGVIPTFGKHQKIGGKEAVEDAKFPDPPSEAPEKKPRKPRERRSVSPQVPGEASGKERGSDGEAMGNDPVLQEGKGRGKGREGEEERESTPPLAESKTSSETENAVRFITAFDACQESVFGALKRQIPHGSDLGTALRWVRSGLTLEFCEPFFLAKFRDLKAQSRSAPTTLSYLTNALVEAKAASELPMPKVSDDELVRSLPAHLRTRKASVPVQCAVGSPEWEARERELMGDVA